MILSFALKILTLSEFFISLGRLFQATAPPLMPFSGSLF
jgi:hypothetical protein